MEPAWEDLAAMEGLTVRLATVDATEEKALAEALDVNGYPTLLAFDGPSGSRAVYEYDGDRSTASLHAFATNADLTSASGRRRGYLDRDGAVRPSLVDVLSRVPSDANEIIRFAIDTNRMASALIGAMLVALGALVGLACVAPPATAFLVVECPAGVRAGQSFPVQVTSTGRFGRRRTRVMSVAAPAGVQPGQSFFVPLINPPKVKPLSGDARAGDKPTAVPAPQGNEFLKKSD